MSPVVALAVLWAGAVVGQYPARGETISAANFRIDIASNVNWIHNSNPAVAHKLWRQTAMEQAVLASRPYVRVTNLAAGSDARVEQVRLNVTNMGSTAIQDVSLAPDQRDSSWKWSAASNTVFIDLDKPIPSGESVTVRMITSPGGLDPRGYTLQQNFFCPSQPSFADPRLSATNDFGVLDVLVRVPGPQDPGAVPGSVKRFAYSLETVVIDPFKTAGQQVGVQIAPVPVPEPSTLVLLAAAAGVGAWTAGRRRRTAA